MENIITNANTIDNTNTLESILTNICLQITSNQIQEWTSEPLNNHYRYQIHAFVEKFNNDNQNSLEQLQTTSISIQGLSNSKKCIKITKKFVEIDPTQLNISTNALNSNSNLINLNYEKVDFFIKLSKLPIPTNSPADLPYYLDLFVGYFNTSSYLTFESDIKTIGFSKLKTQINDTKCQIISHINSSSNYQNFMILDRNTLYPNGYVGKSSIYNNANINKYFISIDIKSANWTCLKKFCNDFNGTWSDFVLQFTASKFIAESKYFREYVFGELGSKKLDKFIPEFIFEIEQSIINKLNEDSDVVDKLKNFHKVSCTKDEIIYQLDGLENVQMLFDFVNNIANALDPTQSIYRVELFELKQLTPYDFFVKKIFYSNDFKSSHVQFKQIPKHFICQAIKHYWNKENPTKPNKLEPMDMKFMFENIICTFNETLNFN